jgi:hypothetical protein
MYTAKRATFRRLKGYRLEEGVFVVLAPDERGCLWLEPVGIWMGVRDNQIECYDAASNLIGDYNDIDAARAAAQARAAASEAHLRDLEVELRRLRGEG